MKRRNIWSVALAALSICLAAAAQAAFADPNLEAAVRKAAGRPTGNLTPADLAAVKELLIPGASVLALGGIEELVNLTRLDLAKTPVRDIAPLARLGNLAELNLSDTFVTDFRPLASCRSLRVLSLDRTGISDLSFLTGLISLERLSLTGNSIVNLEPLQPLVALKYAELSHNQITSVAPLRRNAEAGGLGTGDEVRLSGNPLTSAAYLTDIPYLEGRGVKVSR